jgi:hypothetical protein
LGISLNVAIISLVFLIVIHKLEYFLNARIVGGQIEASAWELLLAMTAMQAVFGLSGADRSTRLLRLSQGRADGSETAVRDRVT